MESAVGCLRVKNFITADAEESLFLSWMITSRLFLSCSLEGRVLGLIRLQCLFVWGECGFKTSIHLLIDRGFYVNEWKVFRRVHVTSRRVCIAVTVRRSFRDRESRLAGVCWSKSFETWNLASIPQTVKKARTSLHRFFQLIDITVSQKTISFPELELKSAKVWINTREIYCQS